MKLATLGSDPEFFIQDKQGQLKSIIGMLGGSKEHPAFLDDFGEFKMQEDNVAAEYNIPPAHTREQFIEYVQFPQQAISRIIGTDKYSISKRASASFPEQELRHPKALEFGCDPDYNAWNMQMNPKPICDDPTFRTAGGHIHIGVKNRKPREVLRIIRAMDKYLGVWSVITDTDTKRRQLYGKAGAFRPQPHGCEYRTLSNFWIFDKGLIGEVWDRTQQAVNHPFIEDDSEEAFLIQDIINNGDTDKAHSFLRETGLL
jgi:hypothetical protein